MKAQTDPPAQPSRKKHLCKRHNVSYGALEQCGSCLTDAGPAPADVPIELPLPPKGCLSSVDRERWYTALADASIADAMRVLSSGDEADFHTEANITAHRNVAIKAQRAAGELGNRREDQALVESRKRENALEASH